MIKLDTEAVKNSEAAGEDRVDEDKDCGETTGSALSEKAGGKSHVGRNGGSNRSGDKSIPTALGDEAMTDAAMARAETPTQSNVTPKSTEIHSNSSSSNRGTAGPSAHTHKLHNNAKQDEDNENKLAKERAVQRAVVEADESYTPSQSILNASTALPLLEQVDGPALSSYQTSDNIYVARNIPVALRGTLDVPIHISVANSVVQYTVESMNYDISFGITADRDNSEVVFVRDLQRVNSHQRPIGGKFLVSSVPCALKFTFDNMYSWFTDKIVSYKIVVTPPGIESVIAGRRRRALAALRTVEEDRKVSKGKLSETRAEQLSYRNALSNLEKEVAELKRNLSIIDKEEKILNSRLKVRDDQMSELNRRLEKGWDDEIDDEDEGGLSASANCSNGGHHESSNGCEDEDELKNEDGHYEL